MPTHRITSITLGVPNPEKAETFYTDFGLTPLGDHRFGTVDGGEQLQLAYTPVRRLLEYGMGVDDPDDISRAASRLNRLDISHKANASELEVLDPGTGVRISMTIANRYAPVPFEAPSYNGPSEVVRHNKRADGTVRRGRVRPRKLGHVVLGTTDLERTERTVIDGLGFKITDTVKNAGHFMRCSTDHHNLMVQRAPVPFTHHTSWQVEDIDEVGRGATAMLETDPSRHVWGLGRHNIGGNFFWYLKDPAGNFAEYYSDLDVIDDDEAWDVEVFNGRHALCSWGPKVPPSFLKPEDLGALMSGMHSERV
jgi:catechol 2,3-dioxygenase-like lactoylglutathione lyase family enzyme